MFIGSAARCASAPRAGPPVMGSGSVAAPRDVAPGHGVVKKVLSLDDLGYPDFRKPLYI